MLGFAVTTSSGLAVQVSAGMRGAYQRGQITYGPGLPMQPSEQTYVAVAPTTRVSLGWAF